MRLKLIISLCLLHSISFAQIEIDEVIIPDSLSKYNYTYAEIYEIKRSDSTLLEKFYFNSNGQVDSVLQMNYLHGPASEETIEFVKAISPNKIVYKYNGRLLTEKTRYLFDTLLQYKYEYSYNNSNQLIKEQFKSYPDEETRQTFYRYKNGKKIYEIDATNNIEYRYAYDTLGVDEVRFNLPDTEYLMLRDYFDEYGSYTEVYIPDPDVLIVRFNDLGLPIVKTYSGNKAESIIRYTYQSGLIVKFESIYWSKDGWISKTTQVIKYNGIDH